MVIRAMFVFLLLSLTAVPARGQAGRLELDGLAFLAGCWLGTFGTDGTDRARKPGCSRCTGDCATG